MTNAGKCIVMGIDGTLCPLKKPGESYLSLPPRNEVLDKLRKYRQNGFYVILFTSRSMNMFEANVGLILANTALSVFEWLAQHRIPYDEIHFGKPWAGDGGFYVHGRAVRPEEFVHFDYDAIQQLIGQD